MQAVWDAVCAPDNAAEDIGCFGLKPPDPPSDCFRGLGLGAREQLTRMGEKSPE